MTRGPVPSLLRGRLGWNRRDRLVTAGIGGVALLVRAMPVLVGGGLGGLIGYDDGVYFGGSVALTAGVLPYRDYLLLHPPGELVALLPFASLGEWLGDERGLALARLATMALGAMNAMLVTVIAGRTSRPAGIVAGLVYATWNAAANAERSTDLHALQNALLLVALLVLAQRGRITARRAAWAGAAVGLATSVQLWQGLAAVAMLWWILARTRVPGRLAAGLRPAAAYCATTGAAFAAVSTPFFLAAPWEMVRYVLIDQLGRPQQGVSIVERLRALEGLPQTSQLPAALRGLVPEVAVLVAAGVALAIVAAGVRTPLTRLWAVLAAAQAGVVLAAPSFFNDYASFVAPAASLTIGCVLARALRAAARLPARGVALRPSIAGIVAVLVVATGLSAGVPEGQRLATASLAADVAGARCVSADYPTLLLVTGALRRNVAARCMLVLDPTGVRYDTDRGRLATAYGIEQLRRARGYQDVMRRWYGGSDAALLIRRDNGFDDTTRSVIVTALPKVHRRGIVEVRLPGP